MAKDQSTPDQLREKALRIIEQKGVQDASLYSASLEDLVQELSVYQIELEHQNNALRETQAQLEASRNHLFDLYHNAPSGYATINEAYEIEEINRTACRMLGIGDDTDARGLRFTSFIHPEDQDIFYFHFKHSLQEQTPLLCELRLVGADPESDPVAARIESIKEDFGSPGESRKIRSAITDITRTRKAEKFARESEQRFIETADLLPDAVFETDAQLQLSYANRSLTELLGFSAADIENGLKCLDLFHPDDREAAGERIQRCRAGERTRAGEYRFRTSSGAHIEGLFNESPVFKNGDFAGLRASITDLTELKRLQKQAEQAGKIESLGMLAGNIAHEFNNLFTSLFGYMNLARMELSPDHPASRFLETAEHSISDARELTGRLLTFSRGGNPVISRIHLPEVLRPALDEALGQSRIKIRADWRQAPWPVYADAVQLRQVIVNIAANALEAMPEGGRLHVELDNVRTGTAGQDGAPAGQFVRLSFKDEGPGISADHLERIFDPYFTTKTDAAGLGLSIVHSIITRHGGHIEVRSEPTGGAEFIVYLPADERPPADGPKPDARSHSRAAGARQPTGENPANGAAPRRILLMDDEPAVRQMSRQMLERQGYAPTLARDGSEAVAIYKEAMEKGRPYDAVIMDLTVPGAMGGKEAIRKLRSIDPAVTAIVSSGYATDPVMADCRAYGFTAAIEKPYSMAALKDALAVALHL